MTLKQKAVLAQLVYLDNTEDFETVGDLVKHYRNKSGYDSKEWLESFNAVESDPYLHRTGDGSVVLKKMNKNSPVP